MFKRKSTLRDIVLKEEERDMQKTCQMFKTKTNFHKALCVQFIYSD